MILAALFAGYVCLTPPAPRAFVVQRLAGVYGETPRQTRLKSDRVLVELFANGDTTSWSLLMTSPAGLTCLLSSGMGWVAIVDEKT